MLRKVLYQLVVLIPPLSASSHDDDKLIKCASMLLLAIAFLAIHMASEPYDNRSYFTLDRIEAASLWAVLITLLVQTWQYISDRAFAFNLLENGDPVQTQFNRDIRDTISVIIVFFFHARFFFMAVFLSLRPFLLSVTRWQVLNHGFVEVMEDGLRILQDDDRGRRLFTKMFSELVTLLLEARHALSYDELVVSLRYVCVNCLYHRRRDRYETGFDEDEDDNMHLRQGVLDSFSKENLKKIFARLGYFLKRNVEDNVQRTTDLVSSVVDGSRSNVKRKSRKSQLPAEVIEELDRLKDFNEETVKQTIGEVFSIEELHMSMVRLNRDIYKGIGNGRRPSTGSAGSAEIIESTSMRLPLPETKDEESSEEDVQNMEAELSDAEAALHSLHKQHEEIVANHERHSYHVEKKRQELLNTVRHHWKSGIAVDTLEKLKKQHGSGEEYADERGLAAALRTCGAPSVGDRGNPPPTAGNDEEAQKVTFMMDEGIELAVANPADSEEQSDIRLADLEEQPDRRSTEAPRRLRTHFTNVAWEIWEESHGHVDEEAVDDAIDEEMENESVWQRHQEADRDDVIKAMSAISAVSRVHDARCEECDSTLVPDASFCHMCGKWMADKAVSSAAHPHESVRLIEQRAELEGRLYRFRVEVDETTGTVRAQAADLKLAQEKIVALRREFNGLRAAALGNPIRRK